MSSMTIKAAVALLVLPSLLAGIAAAAQDKYSLEIPDGLAFSEIKGYETWQDVAVSQVEDGLKAIVANDAMINAYREGVPGNGKPFPEGSKIVKIEWSFKKNPESPYFVQVPDALQAVDVIEKDSKRFPNTHGWAYGDFEYDAVSDTFTPKGTDSECGYACHTAVAAKDYIFTQYPKH